VSLETARTAGATGRMSFGNRGGLSGGTFRRRPGGVVKSGQRVGPIVIRYSRPTIPVIRPVMIALHRTTDPEPVPATVRGDSLTRVLAPDESFFQLC
jgi:hypothetical protein